jgi:hypothetical protein
MVASGKAGIVPSPLPPGMALNGRAPRHPVKGVRSFRGPLPNRWGFRSVLEVRGAGAVHFLTEAGADDPEGIGSG